jgi:excisionase family DNA binding protein
MSWPAATGGRTSRATMSAAIRSWKKLGKAVVCCSWRVHAFAIMSTTFTCGNHAQPVAAFRCLAVIRRLTSQAPAYQPRVPSTNGELRMIRLLRLMQFRRIMVREEKEGNAVSVQIHETPAPTEAVARQARESLQQISHLGAFGTSDLSIRIQNGEQVGTDVVLPASALRLLRDILAEMAQGHAIALLPVQAELTTQQAADLLKVSRPFLIGLLEQGKIPFRLVGQHRRVRLDDLLAYKRKDDEDRRRVADELAADAQELSLGY